MTISTNAQRITRIYRGTTKVFQDQSQNCYPVISSKTSTLMTFVVDSNDSSKGYLIGGVFNNTNGETDLGVIKTDRLVNGSFRIFNFALNGQTASVPINVKDNHIVGSVGNTGTLWLIETPQLLTIS